jgi:predicted Fe-Mo cluster-binding NifX family protein
MKIAVPLTHNNFIDNHFGHCAAFGVFTVTGNREIEGIRIIDSPQGCGCKSDIASVLSSDGVTVMLAGGIGGGAVNVLNSNGIEVIRGCSGDAYEVVRLYLHGQVEDGGEICNHHNHHHNHEGHSCSHN